MSNVTSIADKKIDLATLVAEDKKRRGEHCLSVVNEAMKADNCMIQLFIHVGEQKVPINAVISAPIEISIEAQ